MSHIGKIFNGLRRALAVSIAGLALSAASAATTDRALLGEPAGVGQAALSSPALRAALQDLASTAQRNGSVRVIVGVRVAFAPEGKLSGTSAAQQRSEIASAQSVVLSRLPKAMQQNSNMRRFASIPYLAISVTAQDLKALEQMPEVTSIQKDEAVPATLINSVPHIGGNAAWSSGYSGAGQAVVVLDTGVEGEHPFLKGKEVSLNKVPVDACYSTTDQSENSVSLCPDELSTVIGKDAGAACTGADGCLHGTHVAGIVAGTAGARNAPDGVAKGASIISMQVFSKFTSEDFCGVGKAPCTASYPSDQIAALERVYFLHSKPLENAANQPAAINIAAVNMSLGGGWYSDQSTCDKNNTALKTAIDNLRAVNIATIIASGNDGYTNAMGAPGCISSAISVGSTWAKAGGSNSCLGNNLGTSNLDDVSCFSNATSFLNLLAPGSSIRSSVLEGLYGSVSGTSMATPHVAGAWAVLKQKKPLATVNDVLNALVATGKPVTDPRNGITKPRIQVDKALDAISASAYVLSVRTLGGGTITSNPAGIDCGASCAANFSANSSVTLAATAFSGNFFTGWSGACTGASSVCTITMDVARSVTANFAATQATRSVTLSKSGQGTVASTPSGIYCDTSCGTASSFFSSASDITLVATPAAGSTFVGWGGACSGIGQCSIPAGPGTANVTAIFNASGGASEPVTLINQANISGTSSSAARFVVQLPPGASNLAVTTSNGSGDVDLYVKFGAPPTTASHDCASQRPGNAESCGIATPQPGTYYILLNSFETYRNVTLRVTYRVPTSKATLSVTKTGAGQGVVQSVSSLAAQMPELGGLANPSIVGGGAAQLGAWSWQVRLAITSQYGTGLCGGALISDQWVLTAAHCIEGEGGSVNPANITVRAGSLQRDSGGVVVGVSRIIKHHAYEAATMDNDIALLRLSSPLPLSSTINVVAPLSASQESQLAASDTLATVTGWGATMPGGEGSAHLLQTQVPLLSSIDCAAKSAYGSSKLSSNMICAGYPSGGQDACQGDSGGPLVVPNPQGGHVLAGIVSWGRSCAAPNYPGVYTRVANYQPWLQTHTQLALGAPLLNCGSACQALVDTNTTITLRATASNGSNFAGWSGACSGTADTCTVTLDSARSVVANFSANGFNPLPDTAEFVKQQYRDFLGRTPDSATLNDWVSRIKGGTVTRAQMAESLMQSNEFRGRLSPIVRLYAAYFKRTPDYVGLMHWLGTMYPASGMGKDLIYVSDAFALSGEFVSTYGQLNNTGFLTRVYNNVLGRDPDADGYAAWMSRLAAGMSRGELMLGFSESDENQSATTNRQLHTVVYVGMLKRVPSAAENAQWLADLQAGRASVQNLINSVLQSPEYAARF